MSREGLHQPLNVTLPHRGDRLPAEKRFDVQTERVIDDASRRLRGDLSLLPFSCVGREGLLSQFGIDILTSDDRCSDLVEPVLGICLSCEVAHVFASFSVPDN